VQEILLGYQILATHIIRDQRRFKRAYYHANETVRIAKSMDDRDLMATALDTRGWTRLEWGMSGYQLGHEYSDYHRQLWAAAPVALSSSQRCEGTGRDLADLARAPIDRYRRVN
jgi:hypothetical protein